MQSILLQWSRLLNQKTLYQSHLKSLTREWEYKQFSYARDFYMVLLEYSRYWFLLSERRSGLWERFHESGRKTLRPCFLQTKARENPREYGFSQSPKNALPSISKLGRGEWEWWKWRGSYLLFGEIIDIIQKNYILTMNYE